jgi:hypothetical protein
MADEFKTLMQGFTTLGTNYCANARKVITDLESRKLIDIYEAGLTGAVKGLNELVNAQYNGLSDEAKNAVDDFTRLSGVLPMLEAATRPLAQTRCRRSWLWLAQRNYFRRLRRSSEVCLTSKRGESLTNCSTGSTQLSRTFLSC